jgi:hypothetical protein
MSGMSGTNKRRWVQFRLRTFFALNVLISVYFASYVALVQRVNYVDRGFSGIVVSGYRAPGYRFCEPIARIVFWPAAWLDRQLRPDYWGPYSDFN